MSGAAPAETGLPSGWEIRHSRSRNLPYYFHAATSESRWEPPAGSDSDTLAAYMAVHHTPTAGGAAASTNSNARSAAGGSAGAAPQGKIRASHLLIKHKDSRRPSSWREANITRTKDEALAILLEHESRLRATGGPSLGEIAATESDCSSARKGGDLGLFGKGEMQRPFEEAAFALKVNELSGVVQTDSGVHLILRTA